MQGEATIRRSRTAALKTAARMRCTTPTVAGASAWDSRLTSVWTSLGRTDDSGYLVAEGLLSREAGVYWRSGGWVDV
jgi:hypothetical protein